MLVAQTCAGLEIKSMRWMQLQRQPHCHWASNPLHSRSCQTVLDRQGVLQLNCTSAKLLSIHPSGPISVYPTGQGQFMRKKRHLIKHKVFCPFFFFSRKPGRQSEKMHEGTIYVDKQHGLFKSQVKE